MPKFRYRMQNILDIKLKLEEQAKNEFAQAQIKLNEELEIKEKLLLRKEEYLRLAKELREDVISVRELNENRQAQMAIDEMLKRQETEVLRAQKEVDRKRAELSAVMQERKMHEKLKEKALEAYLEEEKASENKSIDELTSYTFGQRNLVQE